METILIALPNRHAVAIASNSVFLDAKTKTMIASGDPKELLRHGPDDVVEFLTRGKGRESGGHR